MLSSKVEEAVRRAGLTSGTVYLCGRTLFMHVETQSGMSGELDREALQGDQRYVVNGQDVLAVIAVAVLDTGSGPMADPACF